MDPSTDCQQATICNFFAWLLVNESFFDFLQGDLAGNFGGNLDDPAILNANRGESREFIRRKAPINVHNVRAIRATRLKPAIRNSCNSQRRGSVLREEQTWPFLNHAFS